MIDRSAWKVRGLSAGYGPRRALHPLDLDIPFGRTTTVVGPGGSGKTTLLRALAGVSQPEEMWVEGTATPPPDSTLLVPQVRARTAHGAPKTQDLLSVLEVVEERAIVMLDEPFVHLPAPDHEKLHTRLAELRRTHTMICITHNLKHSRRLSDHVVLLVDGQLIEAAEAADFFERPRHPRTADFLATGS